MSYTWQTSPRVNFLGRHLLLLLHLITSRCNSTPGAQTNQKQKHGSQKQREIKNQPSTMAAMFITKNVFFISKAFPQSSSSSSSSSFKSYGQVSRVCFSSASNYNYNEGRDPEERARDSRADMAYKWKETRNETDEDIENVTDKAEEATREGVERAKQRAREMKERAKEYGQEKEEKTKEGTYKAAETAESAKEKGKEYAYDTKEKAKEGTQRAAEATHQTKEKAKEYVPGVKEKAEDMAEKAKEGTAKVADTAQSLGEKAKQTAQGAWGAAKEATQKIRETVVGKDDDDRDKTMDEDVIEIRRRAGERERDDKKNKY